MIMQRRVKVEKGIKPRENMFGKRHKTIFRMRWGMNKQTAEGQKIRKTKVQQKHEAD